MIKLCLLLLGISLFARENPFFPTGSELDIPLNIAQNQKTPALKRATLSLPSTAREIQSIIVKYKNLDGSISTKELELHNSIDWHLPIFISQNYELSQDLKQEQKTFKVQKKKIIKFKKFTSLSFISFYTKGKTLKIVTKDKLLRSFLIVRPHRIVCDFKRNIDLKSFKKPANKKNIFKKITIGTHKGYYRVVIELDGYYKFNIKHTKNRYFINLH